MSDPGAQANTPHSVNGRYEINGPPVGQGGMGVVYKAYDTITKRHVALKTTWGHVEPAALELFEREWTVLARLSHPNIVDILDTGEFQHDGQRKPYFVMPLLPGQTLDRLIRSSTEPFTVERAVDIMAQVCRGLQAAHGQGLVHRDLKPSNIFVMDDDTVKIIDFGVVHLADTRSVTGLKGTLQYMAPEQIELQPATPMSDVFSLGVVCYETLTGRKPFARATEVDTAEAIRRYIPPPVCDINASVNRSLSRTVHKAMAKQPWHRFSSVREFGETLQKALRNEPIERFDRGKIQPRIERIKKAYGEGDFQFATEILTELESEGHMDTEMPVLRDQIEQALRQKTIRQLLVGARTRMEEQEYPLACQKVQDVLNIDPQNTEAAALKKEIERQQESAANANRSRQSHEQAKARWVEQVDRHFAAREYDGALETIAAALREFPGDQELRGLESLAAQAIRRSAEANRLLEQAGADLASGNFEAGVQQLRNASRLDDHNVAVRAALLGALVERGRALVGKDWRAAEPLVKEALALDRGDPVARSLASLIEDYRRETSARSAPSNKRPEDATPVPSAPVFKAYSQPKSKVPAASIAAALVAIGAVVVFTFDSSPLHAPAAQVTHTTSAPVMTPVPKEALAQASKELSTPASTPQNVGEHRSTPNSVAAIPAREQVRPAAEHSKPRTLVEPEPDVSLQNEYADVDLLTEPPGAKMIVDGNPETTCTSPCTLSLAGGRHKLVTRMDGYDAARQTFVVPDKKSLIVSLSKSANFEQ
jgi:serine/threonine-protein kinase